MAITVGEWAPAFAGVGSLRDGKYCGVGVGLGGLVVRGRMSPQGKYPHPNPLPGRERGKTGTLGAQRGRGITPIQTFPRRGGRLNREDSVKGEEVKRGGVVGVWEWGW